MADRDNQFAVWKNEKRRNDRDPHFTGRATINGQEFWVSAWKRGDDANERAPTLRGYFRPKEERPQQPQQQPSQEPGFDDDIPF